MNEGGCNCKWFSWEYRHLGPFVGGVLGPPLLTTCSKFTANELASTQQERYSLVDSNQQIWIEGTGIYAIGYHKFPSVVKCPYII